MSDVTEETLYPEDMGILNAMVTYAMENVPGLARGPAERRVAQVVGRWTLGATERRSPRPIPINNEDSSRVRDDAIARLCESLSSLANRELLRDDNSFLVREDVREALDTYIIDATRRKAMLKRTPGAEIDPVTAIVHLDGGIDALQEMRANLLGERLDRNSIDLEAALR